MRKILIVALLLCKCFALIDLRTDDQNNDGKDPNYITDNFVALATRSGSYDYEDGDGNKRHSIIDDRRNWRKKALLKPLEDHKDYDRWRYDYENQRYMDEQDQKTYNSPDRPRDRDRERDRDIDMSGPYRGSGTRGNLYDNDISGPQSIKNIERENHSPTYMEKDTEKKRDMNCERPHERYEACFAGCASVTCDNPRDRLRPCYPFCESGCICVHPYVRDDRTHKCVLPEDCTKGLKGIPDLGEDL